MFCKSSGYNSYKAPHHIKFFSKTYSYSTKIYPISSLLIPFLCLLHNYRTEKQNCYFCPCNLKLLQLYSHGYCLQNAFYNINNEYGNLGEKSIIFLPKDDFFINLLIGLIIGSVILYSILKKHLL